MSHAPIPIQCPATDISYRAFLIPNAPERLDSQCFLGTADSKTE